MFSLQLHYEEVTFKLENPNLLLAAQTLSVTGMCQALNKTDIIIEAFQDNIDKEAKGRLPNLFWNGGGLVKAKHKNAVNLDSKMVQREMGLNNREKFLKIISTVEFVNIL